MSRFNFIDISLSDSADASSIDENFEKIEENAVLQSDTATTSKNGLMTKTMVSKLNGIATGANKTTVDSALSSTSTNPLQNKAINTALANKVDKVEGKELSTNDYTTEEKNKLAGIATGANKTTVDSALSSTSTNPLQNKAINTALGNKVDKIAGKGLSANDYTSEEKNKLASIAVDLLALKNSELQIGLNSQKVGGKTIQDIENDISSERPYVTGSYTGNGEAERTITLGFTPSAVYVIRRRPRTANYTLHAGESGLAVAGSNMLTGSGASNNPIISIVENGFKVYQSEVSSGYYYRDTNFYAQSTTNDYVYNYIAFK